MFIAKTLSYYKQLDVQRAIVEQARDKEVSINFSNKYFSKRPDALYNEGDVLAFAKKKGSSFHCSEELWFNPLAITTGMNASELKEQRKGWDLILDIDCPYWPLSKLITHLFVKALLAHGIMNVSTKFSVTGDTPVLCQYKGQIHLIPIKKAISLFKKGISINILSLQGYTVQFSNIIDSLEHKKNIYEIYYKNTTFPIRTSPDHSVYVFREDKLISIPAEALTEEDYLIGFQKVNLEKTPQPIPLTYTYRNKNCTEEIPLTKDLMTLIGYYVAEGHLVDKTYSYKKKSIVSQIGFSFHIKERSYINEVNRIIQTLSTSQPFTTKKYCTPRNVEKPQVNTTQVLFSSRKWCAFFKENFGKGAKNKKLPSWFYTLPKDYFLAFLDAYLNGDGHTSTYNTTAKTVSKELNTALAWLCNIHGINCSTTKEKAHEHLMPHGKICVSSTNYQLTIPNSELQAIKKQKYSPSVNKELIPTKGLQEVYYQCKPKLFVKNRVLQSMLKKDTTNRKYIKKIIHWFTTTKEKEFTTRSKKILAHYEALLTSDLTFHKIKKIVKKAKEETVYDVTVKGAENFFGGYQPILLHNSGNKGFHIAVPFESFPKTIDGQDTKDLFPEAPRRIAYYLLDYLAQHYVEDIGTHLLFDKKYKIQKEKLAQALGKHVDDFTTKTEETTTKKIPLLCTNCGHTAVTTEQGKTHICQNCNGIFTEQLTTQEKEPELVVFDPLTIIEVDTILIAHRHLYRMPYSFHEKSELISIPLPINKILTFNKEDAKPENVQFNIPFLNREKAKEGEANKLFIAAYDYNPQLEEQTEEKKEYEIPQEALPEDLFPPCVKAMLNGLKDGRKRALFTIINFLRGAGWSFDQIEETLLEWNEKNEEPLRPVTIKGRLRYEKTKKEPLPPHNCKRYYQDFGVCKPDEGCERIKNPLQYTKIKAEKLGIIGDKKKGRAKLTDEQKEMRRKFREQKKAEEAEEH